MVDRPRTHNTRVGGDSEDPCNGRNKEHSLSPAVMHSMCCYFRIVAATAAAAVDDGEEKEEEEDGDGGRVVP